MNHKSESRLLAFSTSLGWIGILHHNHLIELIKFGFANQVDLYEAFGQPDFHIGKRDQTEREWVEKFKMYAQGRRVSVASLNLDLASSTRFQRHVLECCRKSSYGQTVSYGQLAEMADFPKAARAVGSTRSVGLAATHWGIPIIHLEHENGHGGAINIGVTVEMSAMWPMSVGCLCGQHNLLEVTVPFSPVLRSAAYTVGLETGLGTNLAGLRTD